MGLIALAACKGAPGVTTACLALAAVWPRPALLAECDPAGSDIAVSGLSAADGGRLNPGRGLLSLAAAARRGLDAPQVWEHAQKLSGGLDVLAGVITPEQGAGLDLLWGPLGRALASLPGADVIADCGRVGADGPCYDLLASASLVILITRASLADVVRIRERLPVVAGALRGRGGPEGAVRVVVIAEPRRFDISLAEVERAIGAFSAAVAGGLAHEPRSARMLSGGWSAQLGRSLLIRSARPLAQRLCEAADAAGGGLAPRQRAAAAGGGPR